MLTPPWSCHCLSCTCDRSLCKSNSTSSSPASQACYVSIAGVCKQVCNHPKLSYPYVHTSVDAMHLVSQGGKLLVLDRMLVKLHASGVCPSPRMLPPPAHLRSDL